MRLNDKENTILKTAVNGDDNEATRIELNDVDNRIINRSKRSCDESAL